jgi:type II secretory pathway pseudopilin PulG
MIVVAIIAIIAAIAIPNLMASKLSANEGAAASNLKAYLTAQEQYRTNNYSYVGDNGGDGTPATQKLYADEHTWLGGNGAHVNVNDDPLTLLSQPVADAVSVASSYNGYYYVDHANIKGAARQNKFNHGLSACPAEYGQTGVNTFIICQEGTVYQQDQGATVETTDFPADPAADGWIAQ